MPTTDPKTKVKTTAAQRAQTAVDAKERALDRLRARLMDLHVQIDTDKEDEQTLLRELAYLRAHPALLSQGTDHTTVEKTGTK